MSSKDQDAVSIAPASEDDQFDMEEDIVQKRQKLENDLRATQAKAYAAGTLHNLACIWRSFRRFSITYAIWQWPVQPHTVCLYAQYLAYTFHSAKAVKNYIYGIRTIHILRRATPPNMQDIEVKITLQGMNKNLLTPIK